MDCTQEALNKRQQYRVRHPFSFHVNGKVYKGYNFSPSGLGVLAPSKKNGEFRFYCQEKLKSVYIEMEGQTILIAEIQICWLEGISEGTLFGLCITSIVPPELKKIQTLYQTFTDEDGNNHAD